MTSYFALRQAKDTKTTVSLWSAAGFIAGVGMILTSYRSDLPVLLSRELANTLIFIAITMGGLILRHQYRPGLDFKKTSALILTVIAITLLLNVAELELWRVLWVRLVLAIASFFLAKEAWQCARYETAPTLRMVAATHALLGITFAYQFWVSIAEGSFAPIDNNPAAIATAITGIATSIANHMGFSGFIFSNVTRVRLALNQKSTTLSLQEDVLKRLVQQDDLSALALTSAKISHDLAQPLMSISTHLGLIQRAWSRGEVASIGKTDIERVRLETSRLDALLARYDQSKTDDVASESVNLKHLIQEIKTQFETNLSASSIQLRINQEALDVCITGIQVDLERALANIISNSIYALRATSAPLITIHGKPQGTSYVLTITDNGEGLKASDAGLVGTPFFTTKATGLGLGLSICGELMSQQGIDFQVYPQSESGFEVSFVFPHYWNAE